MPAQRGWESNGWDIRYWTCGRSPEVLESEEQSLIKVRATGSDNKIGSHMKVDLDVSLEEKGAGCVLSFVASVDILGKLATLGHSIIKRKAEQDMAKFAQAVKEQLEGA